jgi:hypothetical protein
MSKKVVHYDERMPKDILVGHSALVWPVDHPDTARVSNLTSVRTSKVVAYNPNTGEFETLNTIYMPMGLQT